MKSWRENFVDGITQSGAALLRSLPPEFAHEVAIRALALDSRIRGVPVGLASAGAGDQLLDLACDIPGLGRLAHPIGLAAGFDKNGVAFPALARLGFSHIEIGAVTPRPQPGNPRPRLFRYGADRSLINRMGFNNDGVDKIASRLAGLNWRHDLCPVGVNIGKNKDTPATGAIDDFLRVHAAFKGSASFFVVNLSSPNTPGLRALANPVFVREIASAFGAETRRLWLKFDPDMSRDTLQGLVAAAGECGFAGLVLTNTHRVENPEAGGQSGSPLAPLSNRTLEWSWEVHRGKIPTIGVGGIMSGRDAFDKIVRGSHAVQIYTAFVYRGPSVVARMLDELREEMRAHGFRSLAEAWGSFRG